MQTPVCVPRPLKRGPGLRNDGLVLVPAALSALVATFLCFLECSPWLHSSPLVRLLPLPLRLRGTQRAPVLDAPLVCFPNFESPDPTSSWANSPSRASGPVVWETLPTRLGSSVCPSPGWASATAFTAAWHSVGPPPGVLLCACLLRPFLGPDWASGPSVLWTPVRGFPLVDALDSHFCRSPLWTSLGPCLGLPPGCPA